ncbi:MAG: D-alanine--D-alanine ligase [Gammaproteobacteria bacterium]|nr:D-alanine--D-alanine ligase [Gammaproteobacteria bacterium]
MVNRVAVLGGGWSVEAEVSRSSARQICSALEAKYDVSYIELTNALAQDLIEVDPQVVFPVLHGVPGEDGTVQGLLELMDYAFVGSDMVASVISMNKSFSKQQFRQYNLPILDEVLVTAKNLDEVLSQIHGKFSNGVVCKPIHGGSAVGVEIVPTGGNIRQAIENSLQFDDQVLVEPYVQGREITVGVLDLHDSTIQALPVTEILVAPNEWYDFTNRYAIGKSEHVIPAKIDNAITQELQEVAVLAHQSLGCRDFSRVDFLLEPSNRFWVLEVNNIPGMTPTSLYPDGARAIGIEFEDLTDKLVQSAIARGSIRKSSNIMQLPT